MSANEGLEGANKRMRRGGAVKFNKAEREIVRRAILAEARRIGERILAVSVQSNHIHVVISAGGKAISKVVSRLKCVAYYETQRDSVRRRLWSRGYDKRLCFDEESLRRRIAYVNKHKA